MSKELKLEAGFEQFLITSKASDARRRGATTEAYEPIRRKPVESLKVDARQVGLGMYKAVMNEIGKPVVFNICTLGALLGLIPLVKKESIIRVLQHRIPSEFLDMNRRALEIGLQLAESSPSKA